MLVDWQIRKLCEAGLVEPYNPEMIGPCSLDLTLGKSIAWYDGTGEIDPEKHSTYNLKHELVSKTGYPIIPGESILWTTAERLSIPNDISFYIDGRSSVGRFFCDMHAASGKGDNGFVGEITLEITNKGKRSVRLRPGMIVAQATFFKTEPCERDYSEKGGRYQNERGATGSRYYQVVK